MTYDEASDALTSIDPDASDNVIAGVVADYLLSTPYHKGRRQSAFYLSIIFYGPNDNKWRTLIYDWKFKNSVGISTNDRQRAWHWIVDAMLAGYCVFRNWRKNGIGGGYGQGSIAAIRKRRLEWPRR
jgi:hypothetical protein